MAPSAYKGSRKASLSLCYSGWRMVDSSQNWSSKGSAFGIAQPKQEEAFFTWSPSPGNSGTTELSVKMLNCKRKSTSLKEEAKKVKREVIETEVKQEWMDGQSLNGEHSSVSFFAKFTLWGSNRISGILSWRWCIEVIFSSVILVLSSHVPQWIQRHSKGCGDANLAVHCHVGNNN